MASRLAIPLSSHWLADTPILSAHDDQSSQLTMASRPEIPLRSYAGWQFAHSSQLTLAGSLPIPLSLQWLADYQFLSAHIGWQASHYSFWRAECLFLTLAGRPTIPLSTCCLTD